MMESGNVWSGLSTENHIGSLFLPISMCDYKESKLRLKLESLNNLTNEPLNFSMFELIKLWLESTNLEIKKVNKIKYLLNTTNQDQYLLLLGIIEQLIDEK